MRILQANSTGDAQQVKELTPALVTDVQATDGLLWLDIGGDEDEQEVEQLLARVFAFHPLAIDDALHETHVPKVDDWEDYLYLALQDATYVADRGALLLPELDLFLGNGYLVSYHPDPVTSVDRVWETCQRDRRWLQHGADHLLYRVIDEIANNYTAIIDDLEEELARLDNTIFREPGPDLLEDLFTFKRTTLRLRRVLAPQREVVNRLARDDYSVIGGKDRVFFRDVYDHIWRLYDLSDNLRDLVMGSMDLYLSVVNNQMNDIMKTLTLITTLFMPLTVLTGFFGMNFFAAVGPTPGWTGTAVLIPVLVVMVLMPLAMFLWMRRRAWTVTP
jgi:magnesium transporter